MAISVRPILAIVIRISYIGRMQKANEDSLLEDVIDLSIHSYQNKYWLKGPKVRAELRNMMREPITKGKRLKRLAWLYGNDGKLIAFYSAFKIKKNFFGYSQQMLDVQRRRSSPIALQWLEKQIQKNKDFYNDRTEVFVSVNDKDLIKLFLQYGFNIDSVLQLGEVKSCYQNLMHKLNPPKDFSAWGLTVSRLRTRAEALAALKIEKREFSRNPQFGWFIGLPVVIRKRKKKLLKRLGADGRYVLKNKKGKVVGFFSCEAGFQERFGTKAGLGLILSEEFQGKGLLKVIYRYILERLKKKNVRVFIGGTSQIPVMKLAKTMGRLNTVYILRYSKGYFPPEYFGLRFAK